MRSLPAKHINLLAVNIGYSADELDCWPLGAAKADLRQDSPADAPGVPFDLSQCGVERGVRPLLYAGHSFRGVALRMDHELTGSACRDAPHRAAEQVRQLPNCAPLCGCDDHIHSEPWACAPREQTVAITDGRTIEFRGKGGDSS